ncbi:MAG: hypothetical protein K2M82_05920 [Lachnospiraceae bacterium]|nr:hypothetical protein [Lachnospiraceae bacterium]
MYNLTVTEKPQLSVGLKFTFMGVDLSAYYKKTSDGFEIFLAPSKIDNDVGLTIKEIVEQFNTLAGHNEISEDDIKNKISENEPSDIIQGIDFNTVSFCLKMLFLNIKSSGETKTTEYAFSLQINAEGLIPKDINIFQIDSLSFNIWNTQRQNVLEKMALMNPESF